MIFAKNENGEGNERISKNEKSFIVLFHRVDAISYTTITP